MTESYKTALNFAKKNSIFDVKYLGLWKGFEVFDPVSENGEIMVVGHPLVILVKDDKARFSEPKESYAILAQGL